MANDDIFKSIDELPKIVKIILCLPFLDIFWAIVRIAKGLVKNNVLTLLFGICGYSPAALYAGYSISCS